MTMLEITQLSKNYNDFWLGPVDLTLQPGSTLGLIGSNGAGKTTLLRALVGTVKYDQGMVKIDGAVTNSKHGNWKNAIGYVGDTTPLFESYSGRKNLEAFAPFYPTWSATTAQTLANRLQINLDQTVKTYSTGQRTKLAIVIALAHQPKLLLLDEPTAGLDAVARDTFMDILFEQKEREELSVVYTTHAIAEIEQLADELTFIHQGQIIGNEIKDDLTQHWRRFTFRYSGDLGDIPDSVNVKTDGNTHEVISKNADSTRAYLSRLGADAVESSRISIEQITIQILRQASKQNTRPAV
jgi:ABC-2 type transport system ATP-binding protein